MNVYALRDHHRTPPLHFTRRILSAILGLILLQASVSQADLPLVVADAAKVSFNSLVLVDRTTAPELVYFSGTIGVLTKVVEPTGTCTPDSPCLQDSAIAVSGLGITGIGLTSGLKYQLFGASAVRRQSPVPGSVVVQTKFIVVPPRGIRPIDLRGLVVPVRTVVTFNANGQILQAATPPLGAASWWQAEGTAADALGTNPGQLSASEPVGFVSGIIGQAFQFGGEGFVQVPASPTLEPTRVTAAAWVRADGSPGQFAPILSKGAFGCDGASYALYTGAGGGAQFYVSDGTTFSLSPAVGPELWDGDWHHVVGTFDGATVRLYVDGAEVGSGNPAPIAINYAADNRILYIGAYRGSCELRLNADVDEVQIFGRALVPAEVFGLFNASP